MEQYGVVLLSVFRQHWTLFYQHSTAFSLKNIIYLFYKHHYHLFPQVQCERNEITKGQKKEQFIYILYDFAEESKAQRALHVVNFFT